MKAFDFPQSARPRIVAFGGVAVRGHLAPILLRKTDAWDMRYFGSGGVLDANQRQGLDQLLTSLALAFSTAGIPTPEVSPGSPGTRTPNCVCLRIWDALCCASATPASFDDALASATVSLPATWVCSLRLSSALSRGPRLTDSCQAAKDESSTVGATAVSSAKNYSHCWWLWYQAVQILYKASENLMIGPSWSLFAMPKNAIPRSEKRVWRVGPWSA